MLASLSQNKKIAISAVIIFAFSFVIMVSFLGHQSPEGEHGKANVLQVGHHDDVEEVDFADFDKTEEAIFVINAEGVFQYTNYAFCEKVWSNCYNLLGKSFFDMAKADGQADLVANHTKLIQTGEKLDGMGPVLMGREGDEKLLMLNGEPLLDEEEKVQSIVFRLKDITKQAEALQ